MNIQEFVDKIKPLFWILLIAILGLIIWEVLKISDLESKQSPIRIIYGNASSTSLIPASFETTTAEVIGSKSGKKYYFPWCSTVSKIKPENQVHFASIELARSAGFVAGGNCKGLQ